jgi:hypothetical protein
MTLKKYKLNLRISEYLYYTGCSVKNATLTTTHGPLHAQNDATKGNIEFLQQYPVVAADALLEIGTAAISAVLSLDV